MKKTQLLLSSILGIFLIGCAPTLPTKLAVKLNPELSTSDNEAVINSIVSKSTFGQNSCLETEANTFILHGVHRDWVEADRFKKCFVPEGDAIVVQERGSCHGGLSYSCSDWQYKKYALYLYNQIIYTSEEIEKNYEVYAQEFLKNKMISDTKIKLLKYAQGKAREVELTYYEFPKKYSLDMGTLNSHPHRPMQTFDYSHFVNDANITTDNYTAMDASVKQQIDDQVKIDSQAYLANLLKYYEYPERPTYTKPLTVLLLDGSGSMSDPDSQGDIKIVSARKIIAKRVGQLDKSKTSLGLIAFNNGCGSTAIYVNLDNENLSRVTKEVNALKPGGQTPLAEAIHKVYETVKDINQDVNLIIVSDGMETCGGDPVYEAKQLMQLPNIKATIYVIGYDVDELTKLQLKSIADMGHGTYNDVHTAVAFDNAMTKISSATKIRDIKFSDDGSTYTFHINFETDSDIIDQNSSSDILELVNYIKANNFKTRIEGYTDNIASKEYNLALSKRRADSVVQKLVELGVNPKLLTSIGYGQDRPVGDNNTDEGRYANRRVEAHFIQ